MVFFTHPYELSTSSIVRIYKYTIAKRAARSGAAAWARSGGRSFNWKNKQTYYDSHDDLYATLYEKSLNDYD